MQSWPSAQMNSLSSHSPVVSPPIHMFCLGYVFVFSVIVYSFYIYVNVAKNLQTIKRLVLQFCKLSWFQLFIVFIDKWYWKCEHDQILTTIDFVRTIMAITSTIAAATVRNARTILTCEFVVTTLWFWSWCWCGLCFNCYCE